VTAILSHATSSRDGCSTLAVTVSSRGRYPRSEQEENAAKLPYPGGMNLGKPLKSTVHPLRPDIPIYLGAEGPKNVAMTAEIADGWIPAFFSPKNNKFYSAALAEGFARRAPERSRLRGGRQRACHHQRRYRGGGRWCGRRWRCTSAAWTRAASTSTSR
jgi:hypothetical protein